MRSVLVLTASSFAEDWYRGEVARTPNEISRLGRAPGGSACRVHSEKKCRLRSEKTWRVE